MIVTTKIFHELQGFVAGHGCFQSRRSVWGADQRTTAHLDAVDHQCQPLDGY
jgi:hypothetical protein